LSPSTRSRARPPWQAARPAPADILEAITSEWWWGRWFDRGDWTAWRAFLAALFALPLEGEALATYRECTGRTTAPTEPAREAWAICGRRAGKTRTMATVAAWLACFVDWRPWLAPGEKATIQVIAQDRKAARVALRYLRSLIVQHPLLKQLVEREGVSEIALTCRTIIEVTTASFRATRGYSVAAILADEVAVWRDEEGGANPAQEIFTALRPSMATLPNSLLMVATTPYGRKGLVYSTWRRHWAQDGDPILLWRATTRRMNVSVPQATVDEAMELDPTGAATEYLAEFRVDAESYINREAVEACIVAGRFELPRAAGVVHIGAVDPAGGSGGDSMTASVCHLDRITKRVVLDAVRERRPHFSPEDCAIEFSALFKSYGINRVVGDAYAGDWPAERFKVHGIAYQKADRSKSEFYRDLLPLLNAGRVELLEHKKLIAQLCALERSTARGGRDTIDHPRGAHDDLINAVALALVTAAGGSQPMRITDAALQRVRMSGLFSPRARQEAEFNMHRVRF
jgi:hypothetical protein